MVKLPEEMTSRKKNSQKKLGKIYFTGGKYVFEKCFTFVE